MQNGREWLLQQGIGGRAEEQIKKIRNAQPTPEYEDDPPTIATSRLPSPPTRDRDLTLIEIADHITKLHNYNTIIPSIRECLALPSPIPHNTMTHALSHAVSWMMIKCKEASSADSAAGIVVSTGDLILSKWERVHEEICKDQYLKGVPEWMLLFMVHEALLDAKYVLMEVVGEEEGYVSVPSSPVGEEEG